MRSKEGKSGLRVEACSEILRLTPRESFSWARLLLLKVLKLQKQHHYLGNTFSSSFFFLVSTRLHGYFLLEEGTHFQTYEHVGDILQSSHVQRSAIHKTLYIKLNYKKWVMVFKHQPKLLLNWASVDSSWRIQQAEVNKIWVKKVWAKAGLAGQVTQALTLRSLSNMRIIMMSVYWLPLWYYDKQHKQKQFKEGNGLF